MKKLHVLLLLCLFAACNEKGKDNNATDASYKDEQTFAQPDKAVVKHLNLTLAVDFATQQMTGKAAWDIDNVSKGNEIIFDANTLSIQKVTLGDDEKETKYSLDSAVKYKGQALHVAIQPDTKKVNIYYTTSKNATAVQWLTPAQTAGKKSPFLFTQSESILARTWVPCQDGPGIRFTYEATVTVPKDLMAVMSADNPQQKNAEGVYHFKQSHPIPSYLLALAVGDLAFKAIDNRTGVYAEPSVVEKAAWEFVDMGKMVDAAEKLYGPYRWGRYDVLILPPSFPFGGMENPNLTFATPTLIAGDRSLVNVIAHELAHSWSGNLVTNATWNDMWLNEGFTVYFERRIVEAVYGKKDAQMQEVLGRQELLHFMHEIGDTSRDTKLKGEYDGRDPDDAITDIPYEKGYAFLRTLEEAVGRDSFDVFLKQYFDTHAFQSRTTEQFLADVNSKLLKGDTAKANAIRIHEWVYGTGLPSNVAPTHPENFKAIDSLLAAWSQTGNATGFSKLVVNTNEKLYFISHLPENTDAAKMAVLDKEFRFTQSGNAEIQCAWYVLGIRYKYTPVNEPLKKFLSSVGRRKFLTPLYKELIKTPEGKVRALAIFESAKAGYHPLAVQSIGDLLK